MKRALLDHLSLPDEAALQAFLADLRGDHPVRHRLLADLGRCQLHATLIYCLLRDRLQEEDERLAASLCLVLKDSEFVRLLLVDLQCCGLAKQRNKQEMKEDYYVLWALALSGMDRTLTADHVDCVAKTCYSRMQNLEEEEEADFQSELSGLRHDLSLREEPESPKTRGSLRVLRNPLVSILSSFQNEKVALQELVQSCSRNTPLYQPFVVKDQRQRKSYGCVVEFILDDLKYSFRANELFPTRKEAQRSAAKLALQSLSRGPTLAHLERFAAIRKLAN